jgi:hypothetical protein
MRIIIPRLSRSLLIEREREREKDTRKHEKKKKPVSKEAIERRHSK